MVYNCTQCGQVIMDEVGHEMSEELYLCETCSYDPNFICPGCECLYDKRLEGVKLNCFNNCRTGCPECAGKSWIWVCDGCAWANQEGML